VIFVVIFILIARCNKYVMKINYINCLYRSTESTQIINKLNMRLLWFKDIVLIKTTINVFVDLMWRRKHCD
jgi:hypothetical protein